MFLSRLIRAVVLAISCVLVPSCANLQVADKVTGQLVRADLYEVRLVNDLSDPDERIVVNIAFDLPGVDNTNWAEEMCVLPMLAGSPCRTRLQHSATNIHFRVERVMNPKAPREHWMQKPYCEPVNIRRGKDEEHLAEMPTQLRVQIAGSHGKTETVIFADTLGSDGQILIPGVTERLNFAPGESTSCELVIDRPNP